MNDFLQYNSNRSGENSHYYSIAEFANKLADIGRKNSMKYFRKPLDIEKKLDASPVTIADKNVELLLRKAIETKYPTHGILGEEYGINGIDANQLWVLDPIDGTKSFVTGMPTFGTLISFLDDGLPVVGVIEMPALKERWVGERNKQTLFNKKPCSSSKCTKLNEANFYTTSIDMFSETERQVYEAVSKHASIRRFGGDCYSYGLLASGHVDIVMESTLEPYDYLALIPVIKGAGGFITDWKGQDLKLSSEGNVLACATLELHEQVLDLIAKNQGIL